MDITIAPTWTLTCPEVPGAGPVVPLFAEVNLFEPDGAIGAGLAWGAGGYTGLDQDPVRLVLLDLGGGNVVIVAVDSMQPDGQSARDPTVRWSAKREAGSSGRMAAAS